jgi:hypothetical protein
VKQDAAKIVAKVGAALEAAGMTPCDNWTRRSPIAGRSRGERVRDRLYNITKPCPPPDEFGSVPDTPDVVDGLITVAVFPDSKSLRRGMQNYTDSARFGYAYRKTTLITLQLSGPPEINKAFLAAMGDLRAPLVSEQKPHTEPT